MSFAPMTNEQLQQIYKNMKWWMSQADQARTRYKARQRWWADYFERNPHNYREELQRRDALEKDWEMQDADNLYKHAQSEVLRWGALINAEYQMRQMLMGID